PRPAGPMAKPPFPSAPPSNAPLSPPSGRGPLPPPPRREPHTSPVAAPFVPPTGSYGPPPAPAHPYGGGGGGGGNPPFTPPAPSPGSFAAHPPYNAPAANPFAPAASPGLQPPPLNSPTRPAASVQQPQTFGYADPSAAFPAQPPAPGQPPPYGQPEPPPPAPGFAESPSESGAGPHAGRDPRSGAGAHVVRSHSYSFVLDARGLPVEIGSGRFAKAFLGEERWLESKTDYRRPIVIKALQKGVSEDDRMRFQIEKELLERVQGHPNIVALFASGESDDPSFVPHAVRDKVDNDFLILERLDMSLEERLKGSRAKGKRDDLLAGGPKERLFRVLDYMIPVASAVEYAHLRRNICHRDIKPANILVRLPDEELRGSTLEVRLADFNVAKIKDEEVSFGMTRMHGVPGTLFFQSPEQETNIIELLVNVHQGVPEVEYFEDFYVHLAQNDTFSLFNHNEQYTIQYADRARKRIVLDRPYRGTSEVNVRARIQKSVGRPADIYSLGALFYYLISGAYANPKNLYDAFHKFIEYEKNDENNTIESYLKHEYSVIESLRAPKTDGAEVAPADRFFSYKHYLDGNGELIDRNVMYVIARCMIRNKPDSYCVAHDVETRGVSDVVRDLIELYALAGVDPAARPAQLSRRGPDGVQGGAFGRWVNRSGNRVRWFWLAMKRLILRR
ncbi:MAG TPA: protein kinase, partial [Polyangiaceae bacterium]|nr:protein kinase [Polyangiaceae bacterium]